MPRVLAWPRGSRLLFRRESGETAGLGVLARPRPLRGLGVQTLKPAASGCLRIDARRPVLEQFDARPATRARRDELHRSSDGCLLFFVDEFTQRCGFALRPSPNLQS